MNFTPMATIRLPEIIANPYPYYATLRAEAPVIRDPSGPWVVTRFDDVQAVLHSSVASSERFHSLRTMRPDGDHPEIAALFDRVALQFLFLDAPRHTYLRALASKAFTPRRVAAMRAGIQDVVDELLEQLGDRDSFDLMHEFAVPLPVNVISAMLAIPLADRPQLKLWSEEFATFLGGVLFLPHEAMLRIARNMADFANYFRELCRVRSREPGDDLLSALLLAEVDGVKLEIDSVSATAMLLIMAGHETTTNLIGTGLLALLREPEVLERLRREPELWPRAIEELLRHASPVQLVSRSLRDEIVLGEHRLEAGEIVYTFIGAANRDPARFTDPDRLDFARTNTKHLALGHGVHYCIGASLARLEAQSALQTLVTRAPNLRALEADPKFRPNPALRGLTSFRVGLS